MISGERIFLYGMFPVADVILIIHTKQYYGVKVDVRIVVKKSWVNFKATKTWLSSKDP